MAGKIGILVAGLAFLVFPFDESYLESTGMLGDLLPIAMDVGVQVCLNKHHPVILL